MLSGGVRGAGIEHVNPEARICYCRVLGGGLFLLARYPCIAVAFLNVPLNDHGVPVLSGEVSGAGIVLTVVLIPVRASGFERWGLGFAVYS